MIEVLSTVIESGSLSHDLATERLQSTDDVPSFPKFEGVQVQKPSEQPNTERQKLAVFVKVPIFFIRH